MHNADLGVRNTSPLVFLGFWDIELEPYWCFSILSNLNTSIGFRFKNFSEILNWLRLSFAVVTVGYAGELIRGSCGSCFFFRLGPKFATLLLVPLLKKQTNPKHQKYWTRRFKGALDFSWGKIAFKGVVVPLNVLPKCATAHDSMSILRRHLKSLQSL